MTDIGRLRELAEQAALIAEKKRWDDSPKYFSTGWTKDTFIPFARWYDDIAAALNAAPHLLSEIETLRAALKLFLDDDRFKIAIGGNPVAVEKMLAFARSAYQGKVTICDSAIAPTTEKKSP